jgi:sulfide:quinone oxidoreductase
MPFEVVIAGGGVAALETVLALHAMARGRVKVRVVAPNPKFVDPALSVAAPFGLVHQPAWDVARVAREHGATVTVGAAVGIDDRNRTVSTESGEQLDYDALVLATGAKRVPALEGALTFTGPEDVHELGALIRMAEDGHIRHLAFAVPRGVAWALPAYELALLTAAHLAARSVRGVEISVATSERAPLAVFGRSSSDMVVGLLAAAGITLRTVPPELVEDDALVLADGDRLPADRVVALPQLEAPRIHGVPRGGGGFIPTDLHGKVTGLSAVYAAGDATWFPVKQGGIAAQQADAVAAAIAAEAGAPVMARSFRPVLRGAMLTGTGVKYLHQLQDLPREHFDSERATLALAFEAADADAEWGDLSSALRWLSVAERLGLVLPEDYADKRERWSGELADLRQTRSRSASFS